MQDLILDFKYALRQLLRTPGSTAVTVLTLACGIGLNTAIFSVVHGVLLRPLPYAEGDRLVHVGYRTPEPGVDNVRFSVKEVQDYRRQSRTLASVSEYHSMAFTLLGWGEPDRVQTGVVSANHFHQLGVRPLLGRDFRAADEQPGADPVLLLTHDYWQRRFGGDPAIVGRSLEMNGRPITVVGVLPRLPRYPGEDDVFMPTEACPFRSGERVIDNRGARMMELFGRLKPGVTLAQARADVALIAARLRKEYPESFPDDTGRDVPVVPVEEELVSGFRPTLLMITATVWLVLLIACANAANLTLARLVRREQEMVVRAAMGASRGRLVRQLLTESTLLALAGGALGLALAAAGVKLLAAFAARFTTRVDAIGIDLPVLLFTLAVSLGIGIVFGVAPAFQASRLDLAAVLKEGLGRTTAGALRHRLRNLLVVSQIAVSFMLLIGAGLMIRSLFELRRVDPGFDAENVLSMTLMLPFSKYPNGQKGLAFYQPLLERLAEHPGVRSAALASDVPLDSDLLSPGLTIEGRPEGGEEPKAAFHIASEGYFRTLGIALLRGRAFTAADDREAPSVAIVNQSLADRYWPGEVPIGKRFTVLGLGKESWRTVVGVVGDVKQDGLGSEAGPAFYLPFLQAPNTGMRLFVRTTGEPAAVFQAVRAAVRQIDPEQSIADVKTLEEVRAEAMAPSRLTAVLLGLFAALACAITVMGISGIVAFSVSERTREIGIRSALGARQREVLGLVLRQGVGLVVAGLLLGAAGALVLTRLIASLLYGVGPADPATYAAVALVLLTAAGVACLVPARRAVGIGPMAALRRS